MVPTSIHDIISVINVSRRKGKDSFAAQVDIWLAAREEWDSVTHVSTTFFDTKGPSLWTALLSPQNRKGTFSPHWNTCLNCTQQGHSMRNGPDLCHNKSGLITSILCQDEPSLCGWQKNVKTYRRRNPPFDKMSSLRSNNRNSRDNISTSSVDSNRSAQISTNLH